MTKEVIVRERNSQEKVKELLRGCVTLTESRVKAELFHWIHINSNKKNEAADQNMCFLFDC